MRGYGLIATWKRQTNDLESSIVRGSGSALNLTE